MFILLYPMGPAFIDAEIWFWGAYFPPTPFSVPDSP